MMNLFFLIIIYLYNEIYTLSEKDNDLFIDEEGRITKYMLPIKRSQSNSNFLELTLFFDQTPIKTSIDISSDFSWKRNDNGKTVITDTIFVQKECIVNGEIKKTELGFAKNILFMDFLYYESTPQEVTCNQEAVFGLARKYSKKQFSLLDQMHNQGLSRMFGLFIKDRDTLSGRLLIGDLYSDLISFTEKKIDAQALDLGTKWGVNLQGIFIGDFEGIGKGNNNKVLYINSNDKRLKVLNSPTTIETTQYLIITTSIFLGYLDSKIFKRYRNDKICKYVENIESNHLNGYYCKKEVLDSFPDISLIINNSLLPLTTKYLFEQIDEETLLFTIVTSDLIKRWTFGNSLLKHCHLIFDYENNLVRFLSDNSINSIKIIGKIQLDDDNKKNISSYDISFGVIIVTNSMGIILLLIALFLQKMYIEDTSITFHYSQYKK